MNFFIPFILLATISPIAIYALAFYWADRHEREPGWLIAIAFFWGAAPAIIVSLIGELSLGPGLLGPTDSLAQTLYENAILAPLIEEAAKGAALYGIYRFFRHEFDGVMDGLTYGALIGFGFAMTENLFYFIDAYMTGGLIQLTGVYFLRTIVFGLNHALYTGLFGIGLGLARQSRSEIAARMWPWVGFGAAVFVHAVHNLGASLTAVSGFWLLLSLMMAATAACFVFIVHLLAAQQERVWIEKELADEVGVLLSESERRTLARKRGQRLPAKTDPNQAKRLKLLVELAFRKHRLRRLGERRDRNLAEQIERLRAEIIALADKRTNH
ncbi:MAG: PrsW family intramembrane metalloprotease [Chloroflexi bacterium]|nr:PrsW family intramembrane metalloprotease [Chloroflexota bacterium]